MTTSAHRSRLLVAGLLGVLAATVVAVATASPGPGLDPDAMSYLGAAQSLARSGAYQIPTSSWASPDTTEPLAHFPPGFSTAIALPVWWGATPVAAARWIIVGAALCTWVALVLLVACAAGALAGALAGLAALVTPAVLGVHMSVLSEPLFISALLATVAGVVALDRTAATGGARAAAWTGVAVAAAVLLRYAGISLLAAAGLAVMRAGMGQPGRLRARALRLALVVIPTAATVGPWFVRTVRLGGSSSVRAIGLYGDLSQTAGAGLSTLSRWLVPVGSGPWHRWIAALLALAAGSVTIHAWRRRMPTTGGAWVYAPRAAEARRLLTAVVAVGGAYFALLVASRLFADPDIPFDERILAPLIVLAELALAVAIATWWPGRRRALRLAAGAILLGWLTASVIVDAHRIAYALDDGNDFAGSDWRDSPTIAWVRASSGGADRVLYTNWPAALYFHAHRASHDMPAMADALTLHRFRDRLARHRGVVVAFDAPSPDVADPATAARALGLRAIARFPDGTVWELAPDAAATMQSAPVATDRRAERKAGTAGVAAAEAPCGVTPGACRPTSPGGSPGTG